MPENMYESRGEVTCKKDSGLRRKLVCWNLEFYKESNIILLHLVFSSTNWFLALKKKKLMGVHKVENGSSQAVKRRE